MIDLRALIGVLGCSPRQAQVQTLLEHIVDIKVTSMEPEVKAYPDIVYHSYRDLGLSLQCKCIAALLLGMLKAICG